MGEGEVIQIYADAASDPEKMADEIRKIVTSQFGENMDVDFEFEVVYADQETSNDDSETEDDDNDGIFDDL